MFFIVSFSILAGYCVFTRPKSLLFRTVAFLSLLLVGLLAAWVLIPEFRTRAELLPWYESSPYKQIIAVALLMLGMAAKVIFDAVERRREAKAETRSTPHVDRWDFAQPFAVSFLVFGLFWRVHGGEEITLDWLVISFQNGFLWQTLLGGKRSRD